MLLGVTAQPRLHLFTQYVIQWVCYVHEPFDESSVMASQPTECSHLCKSFWHRKLFNRMHVNFARTHAFRGDVVHKIDNFRLEEVAFRGLQLQIEFSEALEHHSQVFQVFLLHVPENNDIVEIDDTVSQVQFAKSVLHQPLEGGRHIAQPKRHPGEFIKSQIAHGKCCVRLRSWHHHHLPKPGLKVHQRKVSSTGHTLQSLLDPR